MKKLLPLLGYLLALNLIGFMLSVSVVWSVLHFTNTGLLVGSGDVTTIAGEDGSDTELIKCSYVSTAGFLERNIESGQYGYRDQLHCPWRIDVSS